MVIITEAPVLYENRAIILLSAEKVKVSVGNCIYKAPCIPTDFR